MVQLPYVGKQIAESIELIIGGVKDLFKNPMQALSRIMKAIAK